LNWVNGWPIDNIILNKPQMIPLLNDLFQNKFNIILSILNSNGFLITWDQSRSIIIIKNIDNNNTASNKYLIN